MKRLEGKVAVVTGGAQGIGQCICETFAREGAQVIAVDMSDLSYVCENVEGYKLNVTKRTDIEQFIEETVRKYGHIDILVNNAGITRDALINKMTEEMWEIGRAHV